MSVFGRDLFPASSDEDRFFYESRSTTTSSDRDEEGLGFGSAVHLGDLRDSYLAGLRGEETQPTEETRSPLDTTGRFATESPLPLEEQLVERKETEEPGSRQSYLSYKQREREGGIYGEQAMWEARRRLLERGRRPWGPAQPYDRFGMSRQKGSIDELLTLYVRGKYMGGKGRGQWLERRERIDYLQRLQLLYDMRERMIVRNAPPEQIERLEKRITRLRARRTDYEKRSF